MNSLRKKLTNRNLVQNALLQVQSITTAPGTSTEIQIPTRKERGPTDILKALESTIGRDPTAPHYKYVDDPYLIPVSNLEKRSFALSKEAGRKAAMWVREQHADFFQHKNAVPVIESFLPRAVYTDKNQVSEDLLMHVIKSGNVTDSLKIYQLLEGDVKVETKLALFEMLCFYNSTQPIDDELIEERWFSISNRSAWVSTWKENADREALFKSLKEQGGDIATAAYNALICGCSKYKNLYLAWELYGECKVKGIPICKRAYDYLISGIGMVKKLDDGRLSMLFDIYKEMAENHLQPDIKTFNASLGLATMMKNDQRNVFVTIYNEFDRINVKPSLTSYLHLLDCFSSTESFGEKSLTEVLNKLEGQKLELLDPRDTYFFVNAMKMAYECNSLILGKRLHELLLAHNNYVLIGDSYKENVYYRYYMLLHLNNLQFNSFMKFYQEFIPNIYTPEILVFKEMLHVVKTQEPEVGRELLPTLFSQALMFDFMRNEEVLTNLFDLKTGDCKPPPESLLHKTFAENAWTTWNQLQEIKATARRGFNYSASVLENLAILCLRGEEFDQMLEILSVLISSKNLVIGSLKPESIREIFDACMDRGHTQAVLSLIEYAIEYGMDEAVPMAVRAHKTLSFTVAQENNLVTLVGKDVLKVKLSEDVL
ncbi:protein PTCD3 homolog, mitochondrial [Belonocnema kinseyi]|uniref:protein PTCD3 homolog, mitochondrial n=1 Tax=Belonocnema kinseyi TaxID=2817044 RepID=UPI00143D80D1|nr:protein PTCD3 homolog, mitochondrial [Belonocnema kinseyi]